MKKKSKFVNEPAWVYSTSTAVISFILIFILGHLIINVVDIGGEIGSYITYILYGIFVIMACFWICKNHPKSFLSTIIICNSAGIFPATGEQNFWISYLWIIFIGIWTLSIISGLIGISIGKRDQNLA